MTQKRDAVRQTEGLLQKRNYIRNVLQPTRSICHFRYTSYSPLCYFHKSGDLDLDFDPISKKKCGWSLNQNTSYVKSSGRSVQWCGLYIANRRTNIQTYRQTNRGDTGNHLIHDRRYRHASRRPRAISNRR